jgi:hypothetical protein
MRMISAHGHPIDQVHHRQCCPARYVPRVQLPAIAKIGPPLSELLSGEHEGAQALCYLRFL